MSDPQHAAAPQSDQPEHEPEPEPAPQPMAPIGGDQSSLLRVLSESEIPDELMAAWASETNQDHILGKMTDAEIWERKFNIENNRELVEAMFPPEESVLQGEFRKRYFDLPGGTEPLDSRTLHELSDSVDAAYARSTRSRDGWQQEQFSKQIQEMIRRDAGDGHGGPAGGDGGGLLSRFLGGGR